VDFKQRSTLLLVYPFSKWKSIFNSINKLSIRKPERTSQARAAPVNHPVIYKFYDDLLELIITNSKQKIFSIAMKPTSV
jgi:hypothetical protein